MDRINNKFDIDENGNIVNGDKYKIINNEGGGDCFFYSLIDSGIDLVYHDSVYNLNKFNGNRNEFVSKLRKIVVDYIKKEVSEGKINIMDWSIIANSWKGNIAINNYESWFKAMTTNYYWADDYIISSLVKIFNFVPIIISANKPNKIYCGYGIFQGKVNINQDESIFEIYNDVDILKKSTYKFILIWYTNNTHYENVITKVNGSYKKIFNGYDELEKFNPNLTNKFIRECKFIKDEEAKKRRLNELMKGGSSNNYYYFKYKKYKNKYLKLKRHNKNKRHHHRKID